MSFERSYSIESHERIKLILIFGDKSLLLTWWVTCCSLSYLAKLIPSIIFIVLVLSFIISLVRRLFILGYSLLSFFLIFLKAHAFVRLECTMDPYCRSVPRSIFYRVPSIKTVFCRVLVPSTEYLTNQKIGRN